MSDAFNVRARFKCNLVLHNADHSEWVFSAVNHNGDPEHENSRFSKLTPSGHFHMDVSKEHYKGPHPVEGEEYYLDLCKVEKA